MQKIKKEPNLLDKEIPQDGFGSFTFPTPNGTYTYTGIWKNGLKHGKGVEIDSAGNIINEGVWERGIYTYDKNGNEINYDKIQEDDTINFLDLNEFTPGKPLKLEFLHKDGSKDVIVANHTYNQSQIDWFNEGSALNLIKKENAS